MTSLDEPNGASDPAIALIPTPALVRPVGGEPFVIDGPVRLLGDTAEIGDLVADLLDAIGVALASGDDAEARVIRFDLVEGNGAPGATVSPESYALSVTAAGARITATAPVGLFYGSQTLAQLLATRTDGAIRVPALEIEDAPRFAYRGVMLDVARHFFNVGTVTSVIDRIALAKINHLHLHLSDDQGWRLHIDSWPELTRRASSGAVGGGTGGFYTADDYREIVDYAADRFITIVPEIDLPGHTHAALVAYPELAPAGYAGPSLLDPEAGPGHDSPVPAPYSGIAVGFSTLDVRNDRVYAFIADVVRELAAMTPGPYLHLGGDESLSTTDEEYLLFLERLSVVATDAGKTLVFWHEAGVSDALPSGSIGQYWDYVEPRDDAEEVTRRFVERGGLVVLSPADAVYLDMKHTDDDPLGLVWADGPTSVHAAYSWDPAQVIEGIAEDDILGVEAPLWSETIDSLAGIDALAFPRMLAAAEIAWSPRPDQSAARTWESFRRRVAGWQPRLDAHGIGYSRAEGIEWS
jgi:hexosaminidase